MNTHRQLLKHTLVGFSGATINISMMYFMTDLFGLHYFFSAIFAFFVSTANSFLLNKMWTYRHWSGGFKKQGIRYFFTSFMGLGINLALLPLLVEVFNLWHLMAQIVTIIQLGLFSFFINKYWVFCPIVEDSNGNVLNIHVKTFNSQKRRRKRVKGKK